MGHRRYKLNLNLGSPLAWEFLVLATVALLVAVVKAVEWLLSLLG